MGKDNPMNPHTRDENQTKREVTLPFTKARVEAAGSHPEDEAYHTVRVRIYGENHSRSAPVLPPTIGGAYVPRENEDVAVIFDSSNEPWVVGPWYAIDRVENSEVEMPEYEPGEVVLGNHTGANIRIDNNGDIHLNSSDDGSVYIDGTKQ